MIVLLVKRAFIAEHRVLITHQSFEAVYSHTFQVMHKSRLKNPALIRPVLMTSTIISVDDNYNYRSLDKKIVVEIAHIMQMDTLFCSE